MNDTLKTLALCLIAVSLVIQTIMQITSNSEVSNQTLDTTVIPGSQFSNGKDYSQNKPSLTANPAGTQPEPMVDDGTPKASINFDEMSYDFGQIKEGDVVHHIFKFTNTSLVPLIIHNASGTCGCTVPKWPKEPIPPGKTGQIEVSYDSKNKSGKQAKSVNITANTVPPVTTLNITSIVNKEPGQPKETNQKENPINSN